MLCDCIHVDCKISFEMYFPLTRVITFLCINNVECHYIKVCWTASLFIVFYIQTSTVHCVVLILTTRNTFCGTWYLPHSRVHQSMADLCSNFGDSAITKGQIAYFSLRIRKTVLFLLSVKIWRHHRVHRPWFPIWCRNFGDSAINMGQIVYFSLRMRKTALFLLPVKNLTSRSCSPTPIS